MKPPVILFALALALTGPAHAEPEAPVTFFTNPLVVPEAWPDYGIGDPFVLRFNGVYYLYASTKDNRVGIKVWTSPDLVGWTYRGLCTEDGSTTGAYAPEVTYWNGWFWLATSPAGSGHRFYRSRHPLGPFERFTENLGLTIDGSFFRDEEGRLFFYHASPRGILAHEVDSDGTVGPEVLLAGTGMGHWTEGPFVLKHGAHWFLGLTGNHVFSAGYRENYAVSDVGPLGPFVQPDNNPILISTAPGFHGLGHGSPILGPDLVSFWLVYHNLEGASAEGPPQRSMNLDRLVFNDGRLDVLGPTWFPREAPTRARSLDQGPAPDRFTAEATILCMPEGASWAFGVRDNVAQARLRFSKSGDLSLETWTAEGPRERLRVPLFDGFDFDVAHTLRIEADEAVTVWVDGWRAFIAKDLGDLSGTMAFDAGPGLQTGWAGWSPGGVGDADRQALHPLPARLQAVHGLSSEVASVTVPGWSQGRAVAGPATMDFRVLVPEAGLFGFGVLGKGAVAETRLFLDGEPLVLEAGTGEALGDSWSVTDGGTAWSGAGEHRLSVQIGPGAIADTIVVERRVDPAEAPPPGTEVNAGLYAWVGHPNARDYRFAVTLDRRAVGPDVFGLVVRGSQMSRHPDQVADGYFGYKIGLSGGTVSLTRVQYERQTLMGSAPWKVPSTPVRLEVVVQGGHIRVGLEGQTPWITVDDPIPLPPGQAGWYTSSGRVRFSSPSF